MKHRLSDLRRPTGRRCPALARLVFLAAASVPLACPTSARAEAASAPDSARITWVRFELRHFDDVRIVARGAKLLAHGPVVSSDGLRLSDRGGWAWTPPKERLVPWGEIEAIHARRGASGTPVLLGAVAGLAIGLTISMAGALDEVFTFGRSKHNSDTPILLGVAGGATLGWLIDRPGPWQPVYP
jgi:hypothetical protein